MRLSCQRWIHSTPRTTTQQTRTNDLLRFLPSETTCGFAGSVFLVEVSPSGWLTPPPDQILAQSLSFHLDWLIGCGDCFWVKWSIVTLKNHFTSFFLLVCLELNNYQLPTPEWQGKNESCSFSKRCPVSFIFRPNFHHQRHTVRASYAQDRDRTSLSGYVLFEGNVPKVRNFRALLFDNNFRTCMLFKTSPFKTTTTKEWCLLSSSPSTKTTECNQVHNNIYNVVTVANYARYAKSHISYEVDIVGAFRNATSVKLIDSPL